MRYIPSWFERVARESIIFCMPKHHFTGLGIKYFIKNCLTQELKGEPILDTHQNR